MTILWRFLLNLIYPVRCCGCGDPATNVLCEKCLPEMVLAEKNICANCGKPTIYPVSDCKDCPTGTGFLWQRAAGAHDGPLKDVIHALKYKNAKNTGAFLAKIMAKNVEGLIKTEAVTYVPLYPLQKQERGYNQAEVLAKALAVELQLPLVKTLKKVKQTKPQNSLSGTERKQNLKGVFVPFSAKLNFETLCLVDDVYTTGATIGECVKALRKAGVKKVAVLTASRAI